MDDELFESHSEVETQLFVVESENSGERLDVFLSIVTEFTRSYIQKIIKNTCPLRSQIAESKREGQVFSYISKLFALRRKS